MVLVKNDSVSWNSCYSNFDSFQLCTVYMKQVEGSFLISQTEREIQASTFNLDEWEFYICLSGLIFMVVVNLPITLKNQVLQCFLFGMILP